MSNGFGLSQEEWDALEILASEDASLVDEEMIARLQSLGLVERNEGLPELTPEARLKLASRRLKEA